jgi:hypothetical protein
MVPSDPAAGTHPGAPRTGRRPPALGVTVDAASGGRSRKEARRPVRALGECRPRRSDSAAGGIGSRRPTDRSGRGGRAQRA